MAGINLAPMIDFSTYVSDKTRDFAGRVWIFQVINDWLAKADTSRHLLLTGNPGSGKSAVAARLYEFSSGQIPPPDAFALLGTGFLSAVHFCSARDRRWVDPSVFAQSLALQLAGRYPLFAQALWEKSGDRRIHIEIEQIARDVHGEMIGVAIKSLDISGVSAEDVFDRTVREPLEAMFKESPDEHLVILVDALDEARVYSGKVGIISIIAQADYLPKGVRFILTSRHDAEVENEFPQAERLFLSATQFDQANNSDVCQYVKTRWSEDNRLSYQAANLRPAQLDNVIEAITRKSSGNFQYAKFLLDSITQGQRALTDLDGLPMGLDGLYEDSLNRVIQVGAGQWAKDFAPLLGTLSVSRESLTREQLQAFTGQSEGTVGTNLGNLEQFVAETKSKDVQDQIQTRYGLYHPSMGDFLHRPLLRFEGKELRNRYFLSPEDQHKRIIDYYRSDAKAWQNVHWKQVDDYGLQYLASHLYALRQVKAHSQELYGLICKSFMQEKRKRLGSHRSFATDVDLSIDLASAENPPNLAQAFRGCLLVATLSLLTSHVPIELIGVLAELGEVSRATSLADLLPDAADQVSAYLLITDALLASDKTGEADVVLSQVLTKAEAIIDQSPEIYGEMASRLARARNEGNIRRAVVLAGTFHNPKIQLDALCTLGEALAESGYGELAFEIASQGLQVIPTITDDAAHTHVSNWDDVTHVRALSRVALLFAESDKERAIDLINQALRLAESIETERWKIRALDIVAWTWFKLGEIDRAISTAKQSLAMVDASGQNKEVGIVDRLIRIFSLMTEDSDRTRHIASCAVAAVEAMETPHIAITQVQAFTQAVILEEQRWKGEMLLEIFQTLAQTQELKKAADIADQVLSWLEFMEDDTHKTEMLKEIAQSLRVVHDQKLLAEVAAEALDIAEMIADPLLKAEALIDLLTLQPHIGDKDTIMRVLPLAAAIRDKGRKASVLSSTVQALAQAGAFDEATNITQKIDDLDAQAEALGGIAQVMIQAGMFDRALTITEMISRMACVRSGVEYAPFSFEIITQVLAKVAHAFAQKGKLNEAGQIANLALAKAEDDLTVKSRYPGGILLAEETIGSEWGKEQAFRSIVESLTQLSQINEAQKVAEAIGDMGWKVSEVDAISEMALALHNTVHKEKAVELANKALAMAEGIEDDEDNPSDPDETDQTLPQSKLNKPGKHDQRQVRAIMKEIGKNTVRAMVLSIAAWIFAYFDHRDEAAEAADRALEAAKKVRDVDTIFFVASTLVEPLGRLGDLAGIERMRALSQKIRDRDDRATLTGMIDQAVDIAQGITVPSTSRFKQARFAVHFQGKDDAMLDAALALAEVGEKKKALAAVNRFLGPESSDEPQPFGEEIISKIAEAFGIVRNISGLNRAYRIANAIEDENERIVALANVANLLAEVGKNDKAVDVVKQVLQITKTMKGTRMKASTLGFVAEIVAKTGKKARARRLVSQALEIVETIADEKEKAFALASLKIYLEEMEDKADLERVLTIAEAIGCTGNDVRALSCVAQILADVGEKEKAVAIANRALLAAGLLKDYEEKATGLSETAEALGCAGEQTHALQTLGTAFIVARLAGRDILFRVLESATKVLTGIAQSETLWQMYKVAEEVDSWWGQQSAPTTQ